MAAGNLKTQVTAPLSLAEVVTTGIRNVGMGDRACVDTCSMLEPDEGVLVGSFSRGLLLACSETHPLPYMPPRPFRVNAGAIHSYVLSGQDRTNYLSELQCGQEVLAVNAHGRARPVIVGRVKIERRPLLMIDAQTRTGLPLSLIVQNDWHVRMLGPNGEVRNVTELKPGETLLGHELARQRHVGMGVTEFCVER